MCWNRCAHQGHCRDQARAETRRALLDGNADTHSSYRSGRLDEYGRKTDINAGTLVGKGPVLFVSRSDIDRLFGQGWKLLQVQRREWTNMLHPCDDIHAEWAVIAEKD